MTAHEGLFQPGNRDSRRQGLALVAIVACGFTALALATPAQAQLKQTFYVPIAEEDVRAMAIAVNTTNGGDTTAPNPSTTHSVISLSSTANGTVIYYDHWEDGYEADLANPVQGTTETFLLDAGDFTALESDIFVNPRDPTQIRYDGRDKIGTTEPIAVTRAGWRLQESTLLAGAVEVFPTADWGARYIFPAGENLGTTAMFQQAAASIMAGDSGAAIGVDLDNDGFDDITQSLAAGEVAYVDGILTGSVLTSTDPVQVHLLAGDVGSRYESRWFAMLPRNDWGSSYYTPVRSSSSINTAVLLYNPGSSAITVTHETRQPTISTESQETTTSATLNETVAGCGAPLVRNFTISGVGTVDDVRLGFNATHTYRGDIRVILESPDGTRVTVVVEDGGDGDDNYDINLTDASGAALDNNAADNTASPFYNRTVGPSNPFSAFDGDTSNGTWRLEICDAFGGDSGTFNRSRLEVDYVSGTATTQGTINVPAGGLSTFVMPDDSAAHFFTAGGEVFLPVSTSDFNGQNHDWGHPLLPETDLSTVIVAGWAPGRDPTSGTNPSENGSPIWVTSVGPTTLFIDFDGDPTTGPLVDSEGNRYDESRTLTELQSELIFDPGDGDQSGTRIYTLDGTLLTAAWGQDPDTASIAAPGIDVGTIILPLDSLRASKDGVLFDDVDGDGGIDPGDSLLYTILVENVSNAVVTNVTVEDFGLDANVTYLADSTQVDGVAVADDMAPSTLFPLDEGGYLLGSVNVGQTISITFVAVVDDPLPAGVDQLANQVRVTTTSQIETSSSNTPVGNPKLSITKVSDATGDLVPGQTVNYTISVSNADSAPATGIRVADQLPAGVAYVAESTSASGFEVTTGLFTFDNTTGGGFDDASAPCGSPFVRTFNVGTSVVVSRVGLGLNLTHNFRGDVRATLVSPAGTRVQIVDENPGDGDNNYDMLIQEGSGNAIDDGTADPVGTPYYGRTVGPSSSMRAFEGESSAGTWTLELCDITAPTGGTFNRAQLQLTGGTSSSQVKTNAAAAANPLEDGVPQDLVLAPDDFALLPSEVMTITYQVTVDDPLDPNVNAVINTALVSSLEQTEPIRATVIDPISRGGTIGDRLWLDVDRDGIQDVGEPGLSNVTVTLYDVGGDGVIGGGDDTVVGTAVTDADGRYLFPRLTPGTYYVDVDGATVPAGLATTAGSSDPTATRTITGTETFLDLDVGYVGADASTAILGDYVWSDADGDGVQDPGEPGIGGVEIELLDDSGAVVATTTTTDAGAYRFTGVVPGEYQVRVAASNFSGGSALDGYTITAGPQSEGSTTSAPVSLQAGDIQLSVDFGFDNPATFSLSDAVWLDLDSDGVFDADEQALPGVSVDLLDASGDVIATVLSGADGSFSFSGLEPGNYTVRLTDTAGRLNRLGGTTPDARARALAVTITAADVANQTFGYNGPATVGDRIWSDADGDGVQDADEVGLAGVDVQLVNRAGTVVETVTTDAFGNYLFDAVLPDRYTVRVVGGTLPAGVTQTGDPDAALDGEGQTLLALGDSDRSLDFGYRNAALPDISGNVFSDLDLDGVDDGVGEPGYAGVTIDLLDASGNVIAQAVTDSAGDYSFPDLPAGDYTVTVSDEAGILADVVITSGLDSIPVTVAGADITGIDFGYARVARRGSIGDFVWLDADGNGEPGGAEAGIPGVTVELYDPGPDGAIGGGDDTLLATTVTDTNGRYRFRGLEAGTYIARVDTTTLPGGGTDLDSTTANPSTLILLSEGERYPDADFGFRSDPAVGLIGDFVWFDADADGIQDPGEAGIGGITVELTGPGCAPCTTTTAADGSYYFTGLAAGQYDVDLDFSTVPALYGTNPTNTDGPWEVILAAGGTVASADFGLPAAGATGTIGDLVFLDLDADGVLDAGESGIEGVTLALTDTGGNVLATTVTGADGTYSFDGLDAGSYRVEVTDLDGVLDGLGLVSGANPTATINLASGATFSDADFGYAASSGNGSIGNLVWHDRNADGDRDPGESGMGGVTVDLWRDTNGNGIIEPGIDNLVRNTTTDSTGQYEFAALPDGPYLVDVTDDAGVLAGFVKTSGVANTNDNSQADPYAVTISGGSADVTADFGYQAPADLTIAGTAFFDLDGDGTQDLDDIGVEVVTALLFRDLDGDGVLDPGDPLIGSQATDADGNYLFTDLPAGDFIVAVDARGTFVDGAAQTTQLLTSSVEPVTLVATNSTDNDFGFNRPATLALVSDFGLVSEGGRLWLRWQTSAEAGTVGFHVLPAELDGSLSAARLGARLAEPQRALGQLVPSPDGAPQGSIYRLALDSLELAADEPGSALDSTRSFYLLEVERAGPGRIYGPFAVDLERVETPDALSQAAFEAAGSGAASRAVSKSVRARAGEHYEVAPRLAGESGRNRLERARETALRSARLEAPKRGNGKAVEGRAKLLVENDGLQCVSAADLATAFGASVAEIEARLASNGLAVSVVDDPAAPARAVASWTSAGELCFLGQAHRDPFTDRQVYWLDPAPATPLGLASGGAATVTARASIEARQERERDEFAATFVARDPASDYWHWKGIIAGHPTLGEASFRLDLPDVDPGVGGWLTVHLRGAGATAVPDEHRVEVELGGRLLGSSRFDDLEDHRVRLPFAAGDLDIAGPQAGGADVVVRGLLTPGAPQSFFYVDAFEVEYGRFPIAREGRFEGDWASAVDGAGNTTVDGFSGPEIAVYDLSSPHQPVRIGDASVEPSASGYRVSFGRPDGAQRFLAVERGAAFVPAARADVPSSLRSADNAGRYLVLAPAALADGARDLADLRRGTLGSAKVALLDDVMDEFAGGRFHPGAIADFLAWAYAHWQEAPRYVVLVGRGHYDYRDRLGTGEPLLPSILTTTPYGLYGGDGTLGDVDGDGRPEMIVGRLPVVDDRELDAYLVKIGEYESGADAYSRRVVLAADDPDAGGDFDRDQARLVANLPTGLAVEKLELEGNVAAVRARLFDAIGEGVGWVSWSGHGGVDRLADEGVLLSSDAEQLTNVGDPTFLTAFSCNIARSELPGFTSLADELVVAPGGAAAVWAPSGLTLHPDSDRAHTLLADALYSGEHATLGDLILEVSRQFAKVALLDSDPAIYQLIGDPGLAAPWPELDSLDVLFADGFESATTEGWSSATELGDTRVKAGSR